MIINLTGRIRCRKIATAMKYCAFLLLVHTGQPQACPVANKYIEVTANGHVLITEVAADLASHMCGLAFRKDLAENHGMLFAYAQDQTIGFWMKDTFIHLSIAFLDSEGKILEIHDMDPGDPYRRYISRSPARYALEVNMGWFKDHGIGVGDSVDIDLQSDPEIFRYVTDH